MCKNSDLKCYDPFKELLLVEWAVVKCKYRRKRNKDLSVSVLLRGGKQEKGRENICGFGFSSTHPCFF